MCSNVNPNISTTLVEAGNSNMCRYDASYTISNNISISTSSSISDSVCDGVSYDTSSSIS